MQPDMAKPVVFVIGASGSVGSATLTALAAKYADKVEIRAGVRNPDKADKLKAIAGITIVKAEMGKKDELVNTFKGVNALYIVTPTVQNRAELAMVTAEAAKEAGVRAIAVVSVNVADQADTIIGGQFNEIEGRISKLGVPYTFVRLPYFVENMWGFKDSIIGQSSMYSPIDPTKPFTIIVAEDAGKVSAAILVDPTKHANKTYEIASGRQTYEKVAEIFSNVLGKEVKYIRISYDEAKQAFLGKGAPDWQVNAALEIMKLMDSGSPLMNTPDISAFSEITGEQPIEFKAWLDKNSGGFQ